MPKRGSKRVKKRTHADSAQDEPPAELSGQPIPRSMIVRAPKTKLPHLLQILQMELRKVMSPNTALELRERKFNVLKDYTHVAQLLKVTHLLLLSPGGKRPKAEAKATGAKAGSAEAKEGVATMGAGALLKVGRLPQGPTLTLRIVKYSLCRQVCPTTSKAKTWMMPKFFRR